MESVRLLDSVELLAEHEDAWSSLAQDLPFCHPRWLLPWWDVYGQQGERQLFAVAVFDEQDSLIGIAPWFREKRRSGGYRIKFLGSGIVCSDYQTVLAATGQESRVAEQIVEWLMQSSNASAWEQLRFECIPELEETTLAQVMEQFSVHGLGVYKTPTHSCWRIELPGDMEDFLKRMSRNQRSQARRAYKKQIVTGAVTVQTAATAEQMETHWPTFVELHQRRRESLGEPGCFADSDFENFLRKSTKELADIGMAKLFILQEGDRPVAVEHQLLGTNSVFAYQSGIDPERMEITPGKLANYVAIEAAISEGRQAYDFCRGDEAYKATWRADPVACFDTRVIADRVGAEVKHKVWETSQQLKKLVKGTL